MIAKIVTLLARARGDIEAAADFYLEQAGERVALGFIDEIERALAAIAQSPAAGSPRYAFELDIPGLRAWRVRRHPYLVFYVERADGVDVWRVLHAQRDIPAWMKGEEGN